MRTISRDELYEKVWSARLGAVAKELGLTEKRLVQLCGLYAVPAPARGHWKRVKLSWPSPRPPLPAIAAEGPALVDLDSDATPPFEDAVSPAVPEATPEAPSNPRYDDDVEALLARARASRTEAANRLKRPHKLVANTRRALKRGHPDKHGRLSPLWNWPEPTLALSVTPGAVERALLFYDALVKAVERIGGTVQVPKRGSKDLNAALFLGEEAATFLLREPTRQIPNPNAGRKDDWLHFEPKVLYEPTGRLALLSRWREVEAEDALDGSRMIESAIDDLLVRWAEDVGRLRQARVERSREEARRQEEERIRRKHEAEVERLRQKELARRQDVADRLEILRNQSRLWKEACEIRQLIAEAERRQTPPDGNADLRAWVTWARRQADRIDPFNSEEPPTDGGGRP